MGEARLSLLWEMIALLERYARSVRREDLEVDRETWLKVKAALEVAAQCAIDLALDIVSRRALGVPQTYHQAFSMLSRAGLLDEELATRLASWAGLRNVLVHLYTSLDLDRVHAALTETESLRTFHAIAAREVAGTGPA